MKKKYLWIRTYHKLDTPSSSYWPFTGGVGAFLMLLGNVYWWHYNFNVLVFIGIRMVLLTMLFWWRDLVNEGIRGSQNSSFLLKIQVGVILFILSEVLFFASFFWAFFHSCWSPREEIGVSWPPVKFEEVIIDPYSVPLLKTIILLSSGATVTACHFFLLIREKKDCYKIGVFFLGVTVLLGVIFLYFQVEEYANRFISLKRVVFGSLFFILTGFHGFHVTIGAIALGVIFIRYFNGSLSVYDHVGFEGAAWYWHFVDVVWLFLYIFVYWLGAPL